nr:amidohydrolase family protein [Candidatus Poseidoniaceae archaeon]
DEKALERIFSETAGLIAVHAEDEDRLVQRFKLMKGRTDMAAHAEWRDSETALIATKLAVSMAQKHGRRLHVLHLSSALEADWLEGKTNLSINEDGAWITTETLPQYLTFDQHDIDVLGTRLKMNPPIRNDEDKDVLWRRIHDGTIQCIATDHAPHSLAAKSKDWPEAPSGMPGVETSLPVMLTHAVNGMCTIEDVVLWMSTNVTRIYGIDNKGVIAVGADADLVLVDMHNSMVVKDDNAWTKVGWNPFIGRELFGWPIMTLVSGTPVFERDLATDPKGSILVSPGQTGTALKMN